MKRVVTISWLLLAFCLRSFGQLDRIDGDVRYEHHYQDFEYNGGLTQLVIQSPSVNLHTGGNILSRKLITYTAFTSLSANFISTSSPYFEYSGSQYSWNRYNLILNFLPYSPVKLTLAAREHAYDYKSSVDDNTDRAGTREQEQRAELSVHQIPWLPTLSLSYVRNRSYAKLDNLFELVSQTLTFSANQASDTTGSYYLVTSMSDFRDRLSNAYDRFLTLEFSATRALPARHGVNLSTEFNQYTGYSTLAGGVSYSGSITDKLHLNSSISSSSAVTSFSQFRSLGLAQGASYYVSENFQAGLGANTFFGWSDRLRLQGGERTLDRNWSTSGNLAHRRSLGPVAISNSFSIGYSVQSYADQFHTISTSLANSISRAVGTFSLSGDYLISYARVSVTKPYSTMRQTASLVVRELFPYRIQSQTDVRYRDDHYSGEDLAYRNQRTVVLTQRFNASFVYRIPFTVGLSGSANWYLASITGYTYGWVFNFASPMFFTRGLSLEYVYSRNFDPYYQQEIAEQTGSLSYQWRALSLTGRFRYATFPVRVRESWLTVSRPF